MERSAMDNADAEGDFALGIGFAIGIFIALFAIAIAWFVIEQSSWRGATPRADAGSAAKTSAAITADSSPASE